MNDVVIAVVAILCTESHMVFKGEGHHAWLTISVHSS